MAAHTRLLPATLVVASLACAAVTASAGAAAGSPKVIPASRGEDRNGIVTRVHPNSARYGAKTVVSGSLYRAGGEPLAGELVELQREQVPSTRFRNIAHAITTADGRYRFPPIRVEGDALFRVADEGRGGRTGPVVALALARQAPAYPSPARVSAAESFLAARAGVTAFAVVDSHGKLAGTNVRRRFHSASIVKAMMLVAYLRMRAAQRRALDHADEALLDPMIESSDNAAASAVLARIGQAALDRVALDAHMDDYQPANGWWAFTEVSAADLARFFSVFDSLVPARFDGYARALLADIEPSQSWGIPAVARPEFAVFFKGGWLPESEGLVGQAARLERPGITFTLAVLTQRNPATHLQPAALRAQEAMKYGEDTIAGVIQRLLGRAA